MMSPALGGMPEACLASLLRAVVVTAGSVAMSVLLVRLTRGARSRATPVLVLPLLMPPLVIGYAYGDVALALIRLPGWREIAYTVLLMLRLTPAAAMVIVLSPPPPLRPSARHCWRLARDPRSPEPQRLGLHTSFCGWRRYSPMSPMLGIREPRMPVAGVAKAAWLCFCRILGHRISLQIGILAAVSASPEMCANLRPQRRVLTALGRVGSSLPFILGGPGRALLLAGGVVFMLAFGEFEMASRLGVTSWPVWLLDQQQGGLALPAALRSALWPMAIQATALVPVLVMLARGGSDDGDDRQGVPPCRPVLHSLAFLWAVAALWFVVVWPGWIVMRQSWGGWPAALGETSIVQESLWSGLWACGGAAVAWLSARGLLAAGPWFAALAAVPALTGSLVIGLLVLTVFQSTPLAPLLNGPAPLILALGLLLLPLAVLLRLVMGLDQPHSAGHLATLLRPGEAGPRRWASRLRWRQHGERRAVALLLLAWAGFMDLPASVLLCPPTLPAPAVVRLYNFMHYGHSSGLSAMVTLVILLPMLAAVAIAMLAWRRQCPHASSQPDGEPAHA